MPRMKQFAICLSHCYLPKFALGWFLGKMAERRKASPSNSIYIRFQQFSPSMSFPEKKISISCLWFNKENFLCSRKLRILNHVKVCHLLCHRDFVPLKSLKREFHQWRGWRTKIKTNLTSCGKMSEQKLRRDFMEEEIDGRKLTPLQCLLRHDLKFFRHLCRWRSFIVTRK